MPNDLTSRIRARITPENAALLDVRARALGKSNSRVINDALSASFTFEHDDQRDARILEKLEMMIRHNHRHSFIDQLGAKMKMGGKTFKQALSDVLVSDQDFFRLDEIQLLQKLQKTRKPVPKKKETADV